MRCLRCLALVGLATALACASTQPAETAPLPAPVAAPPSPSQPSATPRDTGTAGAFACKAMTDWRGCAKTCAKRARWLSGNVVAQAQEREEHARRRQDAEHSSTLPSYIQGFALANYELSERRLVLDTGRGFRLGENAELLTNLETGAIGFRLAPEAADHALVERAAGKLFLRVVFRPPTRTCAGKPACGSAAAAWSDGDRPGSRGPDRP